MSLLPLLLSLLTQGPNPGTHPYPQTLPGPFSQGGGDDGHGADTGWTRDEERVLAPGEAILSFGGESCQLLTRGDNNVNALHNQGPQSML